MFEDILTYRVENGFIYVVCNGVAIVKREHLSGFITTLIEVEEFEEATRSGGIPFTFGDRSVGDV